MRMISKQQIIVSGIGGQGVLFITKLIAETALEQGYSALISETHGMAQRGGNVISHLKVSAPAAETPFVSPLIRPGLADVFLGLHPDSLSAHGFYLKENGLVFCNAVNSVRGQSLDATRIATEMGSPVSANLVLLGFAAGCGGLFCEPKPLEDLLRLSAGKRLDVALKAFRLGLCEASKITAGTNEEVHS